MEMIQGHKNAVTWSQ